MAEFFDHLEMRFFIVIFFLAVAFELHAQQRSDIAKLSDDAKTIVAIIEEEDMVPSDTMGLRSGYLPKDYPLTLLRQKLTIDELVYLTNHKNPVVRSYAFKALTMMNEPAAFDILKDHLQDTIKVSTYYGCFRSDEYVGDFFVSAYRGREAVSHDSIHLNLLDSLLIFTPNKLRSRDHAIRNAAQRGKYYNRIRDFVVNEKLGAGIIALAHFKNPDDVDIIMETAPSGGALFEDHPLGTTLFAISLFPDPGFLPFLEHHLPSMMTRPPDLECRFLYRAISNYNNKKAKDLLSQPLQIPDRALRVEHLEALSEVLKKNSHPVYDDLRRRLKEEAGTSGQR